MTDDERNGIVSMLKDMERARIRRDMVYWVVSAIAFALIVLIICS